MKPFAKSLGLLLLTLLLVACGGAGPSATEAAGADSPAEEASAEPSVPASLCSVQYMPVVEGATWHYEGSSETGPYNWSVLTSEIGDASFTVTQTHNTGGEPLILTQRWTCSEEGATALEYGGGADASLTYSGLNVTLETLQTTGITIPRSIQPGDSWQQTFEIEGTIQSADIESTVQGTITQDYQAIGIESVSTPVGSFDALKLDIFTTFNLQASVMGITVPFNLVSTNTSWLVSDIGWVKTTGSATMEGASGFETTIELQSYNIP